MMLAGQPLDALIVGPDYGLPAGVYNRLRVAGNTNHSEHVPLARPASWLQPSHNVNMLFCPPRDTTPGVRTKPLAQRDSRAVSKLPPRRHLMRTA